MASFTLDDIRSAAEKKYGSTDIDLGDGETLRLLNPLKLKKDKRKKLMSIQSTLESEEDVDQEDVLSDAIRLVADSKEKAEKLLDLVGDDLTVLAEIFERYTGESQVGEASASQG